MVFHLEHDLVNLDHDFGKLDTLTMALVVLMALKALMTWAGMALMTLMAILTIAMTTLINYLMSLTLAFTASTLA